jgi:hypothetical protein
MTVRQAEKLLGGYAAGILTEEERSALFQAALKDQALFDALADEDLLRELLADPEAKAKLLGALAEPAVPKVVPFWRRSAVMGLAASLAISVVGALAYLRSKEEPASFLQERQNKALEAAPAAPPRDGTQRLEIEAPAKEKASRAPAPKPSAPEPLLLKQRQDATPAPVIPAPAPQPAPMGIPEKAVERNQSDAQVLGGIVAAQEERRKAEKVQAKKSMSKEPARAAEQAAPSAAAGAAAYDYAASAQAPSKPRLAEPIWTLEKLSPQQARLRVLWQGSAELRVVWESHGNRLTLLPVRTEQEGDQHQAEFSFALGEGDPVDLYLIPPQADKAKADAPATFRRRIHPAKP